MVVAVEERVVVATVLAARSSVRVGPQPHNEPAQNVFLPASGATIPDLGDSVRR